MKTGIFILFGIFLIGLVSAVPVINDIEIDLEQPLISENVTICANITDDVSEIAIVRINLHSENPFWNWGLVMDEENGSYCRMLSPQLLDASEGKEISYYVSARNTLSELTTGLTDYFSYREAGFCGDGFCENEGCLLCSVDCGECPEPDDDEEDDEDDSSTSNLKHYCEPSWKCGTWELCKGGFMYRKCYDRNGCSNSYNKPNEITGCELNEKVVVDEMNEAVLVLGSMITFVLLGILIVVVVRG
jgi:hypothetical protein